MFEEWHDFTDTRTLTRGGSAGNLSVRYSPGAQNRLALVLARLKNGDTVARTGTATVRNSGGSSIVTLHTESLNAAAEATVPNGGTASTTARPAAPLILSGSDYLELVFASVAATEDATFGVMLLCSFSDPTVTEVNA